MSVIALTGATGFVGGATLKRLREAGHSVRALTRRDQAERPGVIWVKGTLTDAPALADLVAGADAVLHIAGVVNAPDHAGFVEGNVTGTAMLIDAARGASVRRFICVSSLAAREPALSDYGATKAGGETLVRDSGLDWTVVRPPAVYGPHDSEMFEMFRMAAKGVVTLPPPGRLSMIHVDDLARLLVAVLADAATIGAVYEPDDGHAEGGARGWSHVSLAHALGDAVGRRVWPVSVPAPLLRLAAHADRLVRGDKAKLTPDRAAYFCHPDWVSNADAAPPASLWMPQIATPEGLADTAQWYRAEGWM